MKRKTRIGNFTHSIYELEIVVIRTDRLTEVQKTRLIRFADCQEINGRYYTRF